MTKYVCEAVQIVRTIYVAEAQNGMIKIGCSNDAQQRVLNMCSQSPIKIRLIAAFPGSILDERAIHQRFRDFAGWAEWYYPVSSVAQYVASVRGVGIETIEPWEDVGAAKSLRDIALKIWERRRAKMNAAIEDVAGNA